MTELDPARLLACHAIVTTSRAPGAHQLATWLHSLYTATGTPDTPKDGYDIESPHERPAASAYREPQSTTDKEAP